MNTHLTSSNALPPPLISMEYRIAHYTGFMLACLAVHFLVSAWEVVLVLILIGAGAYLELRPREMIDRYLLEILRYTRAIALQPNVLKLLHPLVAITMPMVTIGAKHLVIDLVIEGEPSSIYLPYNRRAREAKITIEKEGSLHTVKHITGTPFSITPNHIGASKITVVIDDVQSVYSGDENIAL